MWVLFKSLRRDDRKRRYPFIVLTHYEVEELLKRDHCRALQRHGVLFARVPPIPVPKWADIPHQNWRISMDKISGIYIYLFETSSIMDES